RLLVLLLPILLHLPSLVVITCIFYAESSPTDIYTLSLHDALPIFRAEGGVSRMSDPEMIEGIIEAVSIPVMAKARIGHFVEAQVLQELGVDYIDESEVLSPADYVHHIDKHRFDVPFVCGATNLGEALRRITEGAVMIRSKGEAGTGDVSEATRHIRTITAEIRALAARSEDELYLAAKDLQAPYALVRQVAETGALPVALFTAGGVATPADAAMM